MPELEYPLGILSQRLSFLSLCFYDTLPEPCHIAQHLPVHLSVFPTRLYL